MTMLAIYAAARRYWWVAALAAVLLGVGWLAWSRDAWRDDARAARVALGEVERVQRDVNAAAKASKARVEAAQSTITERTDNATLADLATLRADYARYRRLHPDLARRPVARVLSGVSGGPAVAPDAAGAEPIEPVASVVDIAEAGDVWRAQLEGWQGWYEAQRRVDRNAQSLNSTRPSENAP